MKKKILMVSHSQFGYIAGYVQYCKYLKADFDITFLCWDYQKERLVENGVPIYYISREGSLVARNLRFITTIMAFLRENTYHCVFMCYFQGCSIIPLFYNQKYFIHLNIMTGNVSSNALKRKSYNAIMRLESRLFKSVSTISKSLQKHLKITSDAHIFPLGSDPIDVVPDIKHRLSMIYVGVLSDRNIEDTIEGLDIFLNKNPGADIHYTIIGDGWKNEIAVFNNIIKKRKLERHVSLEGYILYKDLGLFFGRSNVGVAYIPTTTYFDCQPSTKIYEYLMTGIPTIATATYENKRIINSDNGVITDFSPESFARGIAYMYKNIRKFDPSYIKDSVVDYRWGKIVNRMKEEIM